MMDKTDQMEKRIFDAVDAHADDFIEFFRELVRCRSLTKHEQEMADKLARGLKDRGMKEVEIIGPAPDRPNVVATYRGAEDGPTFTFNGHLDVIAPQHESSWEHPPFSADMADGRIYGRGTVDMKAGTVTSFLAGLVLTELEMPIKGKVVFTGVCDEEICGDDGAIFLVNNGTIKKERPDDIGLNCEPTDLAEINIATKGVMRIDVTVRGKGAFNARPYLGINAIEKSAKFITEAAKYHEEISTDPKWQHRFLEPRSATVALIEGGEATNLVPEIVKMTIQRRMHPGETKEGCVAEVQRIVDRLHAEDPDFNATVTAWPALRPPVELETDTPLVRAICRAQRAVLGTEPELTGSSGGTDASHIVAMTGMEMPVYGPGDYRTLGTAHENVPVSQLLDAVKIYALIVWYMMGVQ